MVERAILMKVRSGCEVELPHADTACPSLGRAVAGSRALAALRIGWS